MIKVKFIHIKCYLFLSKVTFGSGTTVLLSQLTEHSPPSLLPRPLQMDNYQYKLVGVFISRGRGDAEEGPVNSGPPHLAPDGDQQFSAGCLASVLTH